MFRFGLDNGISSTQAYKRCSSSSSIIAAIFGSRDGGPDGCCSGLETVTNYALWLRVTWQAATGVVQQYEMLSRTTLGR